jgi:hypothetical protein
MKLSQSPEAMEIKRRLREGMLGPARVAAPLGAAEHNRRARQLVAQERWDEQQRELSAQRLQRIVDQQWTLTLDARRELEAQAARNCHRAPGDPDWAA